MKLLSTGRERERKRERDRAGNLPKGLKHGARGTAAALDACRSVQLEQHHAHNVAQEQQIEEYGDADGHNQYVVEVVVIHPAARERKRERGGESVSWLNVI